MSFDCSTDQRAQAIRMQSVKLARLSVAKTLGAVLFGRTCGKLPAVNLFSTQRKPLEMDFFARRKLAQGLFDLVGRINTAWIIVT